MVEQIELTMSHVGLGTLNEYALMVLFGNAHSHALVKGLPIKPDEIQDRDGNILYPAYYMTKLKVPEDRPLMSYKLWDMVDVGVSVSRFGDSILQSNYILTPENCLEEIMEEWKISEYPSMEANSLFIVDGDNMALTRRVAIPKPECIAELPKMKKMPQSIIRAKNIRGNGFSELAEGYIENKEPFIYYVNSDQDAAHGHAMIFAKFVKIGDWAEEHFLKKELVPYLPLEVIHSLETIERETYYYGNCQSGENLLVFVKCKLAESTQALVGEEKQMIRAGILETEIDIYNERNHVLLASMYTKKQILIAVHLQDFVLDVKRAIKKFRKY